MERLNNAVELLDGELDGATLAGNLRDLKRINRLPFGGASISLRAVKALARGRLDRTTVLDAGTGGADIPIHMFRATAYSGLGLEFHATDVRREIVDMAKAAARDYRVQVRLARIEDEAEASFDIVHSSLLFHHLEPPQAVEMFRQMTRVARRAVVVNDLDRSKVWLRLARLMTRLTTNEYTRHDAPLSVQRAYRPAEIVELARAAGLVEQARYWTFPRYRYALVFKRG